MKKFIKTPFPGETVKEAPWTECTTWYMERVLWGKHKKAGLPVLKQKDYPEECYSNGQLLIEGVN